MALSATNALNRPPVPEIAGYAIVEAIHQSRVRSVYGAIRELDGTPVVIKTLTAEYPTREHAAELRREFHILSRLQSIETVIRVHALQAYGNGNFALVLERFGRSLASQLATSRRGLTLERFFPVAIAVTDTLARLHELDVVHKNIEPGSILLDECGALRLIDFRVSSELSLERQNDTLSRRLEGALPYMSPEQTARMNRELDYRSDYYSLGVTLFELLTNALPFKADSPLEWVHSHISRVPRQANEVDPAVPQALSSIVMKLLAKNAEDRYQSSYGLVEDLRRCERELKDSGTVRPFTLGQHDVARRFQLPQRLYGREPELAALFAIFQRVAAGSIEVCMVAGQSGVGKSALVNEIVKPLVREDGYLIQGKFDQFQRSTPYSAAAAAFRGLVGQLLAEARDRQERLRRKLHSALAPNAQLLIDLIPELELIVGPQPPVPELPPTEAQNRFQLVFLDFVRVIAEEQPLVIFLDDLQFGDASTLNLLRWLATAREVKHLLVIGAYRSNEVDVSHPVRLALGEIQESRPIHEFSLQPLGLESVEQFIADVLHTESAESRRLAELLHDRAQGNPFFLIEMLKALEQAHAITFDADLGRWQWDIESVRRSGLSDNVVEFVIANLRKLPPATQRVLQLASCIGNSFDLRTLSIIHEHSLDETAEHLLPALQRHMVIPLNDDYKLVGKAGAGDSAGVTGLNPIYRFQHDRIQQAAYALIDADRRQVVHLSVGRLIQAHANAQEREERLIEIVGHLNEGRRLISDAGERKDLARLNLAAGIQAQRSSAYESGLRYLRIGQELLPTDAWADDYDLAMMLAMQYQQCAYLTARYDEAESWIEQLLERARTTLEKAEILSMRTRQYSTVGKMPESIRAAIMGLSLLGMRITENPSRAAISREIAAAKRNLAGRNIADLAAAPMMSDRPQLVAMRLLMEIFPAAFLSGSGNLFPFLVLRSVNISLRNGTSAESAFAYAAYGMLLCGALDDPALGYEFGKLAVAMNDRLDDIALKSRVIYVYAMFIHHWSNHWSTMTPWFRRGIEAGYQSGDLLYLAYSAQDCIIWDPKLDLEPAAEEHAALMAIVRDCKYQDSLDSGTLFLQMQRNFLGLTESLCSLNDVTFDEQRCVDGMRQRRFMTGVANYHIYKAEICFFYGDYARALEHVHEQDRLIASAMSLPQLARFYITAFLTLTASLSGMTSDEQARTYKRLRLDLKRMTRWAAHCPPNFLHLQCLMEAELARLRGRVERALHLYDESIAAAHRSEFRRDEAMANELAARHLLAADRRKAAEGDPRAARNLYQRWGARRKVAHLEEEFGELLRPMPGYSNPVARVSDLPPPNSTSFDLASLDMASVLKASQAISSEVVLGQLWTITMRIMLENAGGQRGCFVVPREGTLVIEGLCEIGREPSSSAGSIPLESAEGALAVPISIVYTVLHTDSAIVLHDAAHAAGFARDGYLLARRPQSVLCIPMVRNGRREGVIYMENSLAAGVFTDDRIEILKLLAAQMSISVENATLYDDQTRLIAAQRRFVPRQFLESLNHSDIARVECGEHVAKTMSMMFADLRDFTSIAERLGPRTTIELLNRYFQSMEGPITERGGFIDSFAGDEIKALFDASADVAVRAGIAMARALEDLNRRSALLGQPSLQIGIGVNTGPMVLGTVGGHDRIQCSVVGDAANLASRIEQLTKVYGARFLIGEDTFALLSEPQLYTLRRIDRVAVRGRNGAVALYEVLDAEPQDRRTAKLATLSLLNDAIEKYFDREFDAALALFRRACAQDPQDTVPSLFVERCMRYLREPPPAEWQGFERLTQ